MIQGRAQELAMLAATLDRECDEPPDPVLLVGDAGMGKSALLDAVARRAFRRGIRVVRAATPQGADAAPFGVVEDIARALPDAQLRLPHEDAAILRSPPPIGAVGADRVAPALLHMLAEAAHREPLLLLLDDLHWADSGSLSCVCLCIGRMQMERVAIIGAARPRPPLDPRLHRWRRIDVGPLDGESAVQMLRAALPDNLTMSEPQAHRVVTALGRCPLAITQCTRLLSTKELVGESPMPDPLPLDDRLMEAWGTTWAQLPDPIRTAILALCLAQGSAGGLLARLLAELGLTAEHLDPVAADRLLVCREGPEGSVADLAHPLIRDAVLAAAGPERVRAMHRAAARAAKDLALTPSVVIAHLKAGAVPGDRDAIDGLLTLADTALAADLGEPAASALLAAASLTPADPQRSRLGARAAQVLLASSLGSVDSERVLALVDLDVLHPDERVWVEWLGAEFGVRPLGRHLRALDSVTTHAIEAHCSMTPWILLSAVLAAWSLEDRGAAVAHAESLLGWAEDVGDDQDSPYPGWWCRAVHALNLFQVGDVAAAHTALSEVRTESARWNARPRLRPEQHFTVLVVGMSMGGPEAWIDLRLDEVSRCYRGEPCSTLASVRAWQAERARRRGELVVARALIDESLALFRSATDAPAINGATTIAVRIGSVLGDLRTYRREVAELRDRARELEWPQMFTVADRSDGLVALGEGRIDDALIHLEPLAEDHLLGCGPWDVVPMGRADLVEALVRSGERGRAARVAAALERTLGPSRDPGGEALVARVQGLVGRGQGARAALHTAVMRFREAGDPFEEARTHLLLGELLRRERQVAEARHQLRRAAAAFERMGAPMWLEQALGELRATGAAMPAPAPDALSSLTPQERRVAEAAATGASDRQVAAELFLSPRTVAYHLSSAYRKLGISSRAALSARLASGRSHGADDGQAGPG